MKCWIILWSLVDSEAEKMHWSQQYGSETKPKDLGKCYGLKTWVCVEVQGRQKAKWVIISHAGLPWQIFQSYCSILGSMTCSKHSVQGLLLFFQMLSLMFLLPRMLHPHPSLWQLPFFFLDLESEAFLSERQSHVITKVFLRLFPSGLLAQ